MFVSKKLRFLDEILYSPSVSIEIKLLIKQHIHEIIDLIQQFTREYYQIQNRYYILQDTDFSEALEFCKKYSLLFEIQGYQYWSFLTVDELEPKQKVKEFKKLIKISNKTKNKIYPVAITKNSSLNDFLPLQIHVEDDEDDQND